MIRENKTKAKLKNGEPVFGVITTTADAMLAELIGLAGFDYYMLDAEHGPISPSHAADFVRACEGVNLTPLVRVGPKDAKLVLQYLDSGMLGVMMPGLMNVADVQLLVDAVKYPPLGRRGLGLIRAADYAPTADYVTFANAQTLVLPQFEHPQLLADLAALAAVPGVDGFVIGPRDLALNMGLADGPQHPQVQTMMDEVMAVLNRAGLAAGITAATGSAARAQVAQGARLILTAVPSLIEQSARAFLEGARP